MEFQTTSYICRYCKGSFDHVENLQKHVEQIHTPRPTKDKFKFCPLCGLRCAKYETYRDHLKHIHRLSEEGKVFVLKCFNDFQVWKNELEKQMYCKYIQQGQPKVTQFSKDKIYVYRCDSSSSSTKEKKKNSWAAKDTCPSTISAIENVTNHTVKVEHWNTHVGHAIPIEGEELDAAIGSLQTTEIIIDEQSYQSSDHDSQSGLCFITENNDGCESFVKETNKKQPPSLFKNNGSSSPSSMPRTFSFKKDPNKKSVSFSGSLASVACMKATVKKDSASSGSKVTIDTKSTPAMSSVVDSAYSKFVSDAKNIKSSTPVKTNSRNQKSGNVAAKQLASKPSETLMSNMVNDKKLNGQFILLNSLQGPNGLQSLILCPVDGTLPSGVQPKNSDSKATPSKKGRPPGKSLVSAGKNTSAANDQDLKGTEPQKTDISTKSDSAEKSDNEAVKDAVAAEISVEGNLGGEKSSITREVSETPVNISEDVPGSDSTKKISVPLVSILNNKSGSTDETNVSIDSTKKPKQIKKIAPRKPKLPVSDKALPVASSSTTTPNAIGTILRNNVTGQQIMVPMNLVPGLTNINLPMNKAGSMPMPVAGNVLCNSLTPGMSYIQINNTLIPISTPGGPNLNSNFILTTPVSTSSNPQTSQPVLSFSALSQPSTAKTLVTNTPISSVAGSVPGNAMNKAPNNNLSVFVIPQTGGKSAISMPTIPNSGVRAQNSGKPVTSGQMSKPTQIISNSPRLQNTSNVRSPLIQSNAQYVPPRLLAVAQLCQKLNTPGSPGLTPIRGLGPVASNASQVKTVQLPLPLSKTSPLAKATSNSNSVNSVVSNSGSISSTTAISIPSNPIPHPQKPGSFIFESSGDFFVLEPIEDSKPLKAVPPVEQIKDLKCGALISPKVQSKVKAGVIACDTVRSSLKSSPKYHVPDSPKENTKIEVKLPKPRNYSRFYDGKRVSTLAQKRLFKEEDSDILQKVKYYNLEMKYLSSQAECKRLKLELAKSNMKKKESVETEPVTLNDSPKEDNVPDELIIDQLTKNLLNKIEENEAITKNRTKEDFQIGLNDNKPTEIGTNEEPMDYENIDNEIRVDQLKEVTNIDAEERIDVINKESEDKNLDLLETQEKICKDSDMPMDNRESHNPLIGNDNIGHDNKQTEIGTNEEPMDYENIDNEIRVDQLKEVTNIDAEERIDVIDKESEGKNLDLLETQEEICEDSDMPMDNRESHNPLIDNDNIVEQSMDGSQSENKSLLNEIPVSSINNSGTVDDIAQNRELVNECLDSFVKQPEITSISEDEIAKTLIDQNLSMYDKSGDLVAEKITETKDIEHDQHALKDDQYFEEKSSEKPETDDNPCIDQSAQQTLKDLEIKYGDKDLDVYTMIRTSVLRSLYADMQDLCEQNKKLFEELQSLKSNEETYEVIVQETPTEQF